MLVHRSKAPLLLAACLIFFAGCQLFRSSAKPEAARGPYDRIGALSSEFFHSPTGDIAGHFPDGWLLVNIEKVAELDDLLFVYTDRDRKRALVLSEIPGTAEVRRSVERDGIAALAEESFLAKTKKKGSALMMTRKPEVFTENENLFASYEYTNVRDSGSVQRTSRVAVFTTGPRFYELGLIELAQPQNVDAHAANFRLLESVIGTLEGVAKVSGALSAAPAR